MRRWRAARVCGAHVARVGRAGRAWCTSVVLLVVVQQASPIGSILPPIWWILPPIGSILLRHQTRQHPPNELDLVQDVDQDSVIIIALRGCGCGCGAAPAAAATAAAVPLLVRLLSQRLLMLLLHRLRHGIVGEAFSRERDDGVLVLQYTLGGKVQEARDYNTGPTTRDLNIYAGSIKKLQSM